MKNEIFLINLFCPQAYVTVPVVLISLLYGSTKVELCLNDVSLIKKNQLLIGKNVFTKETILQLSL
jgi:hypothetical protein